MGRWLSLVLILSSLAACSDDVTARKFRFEPVTVAGDLGSARTPSVFYDGYYLQVVWSEDRGLGPDLYIQGFDQDGNAVGHPRRITESRWSRRPVVLQIDDAFVIAWSDRVDGMMEVMAAGLNPRGGELLAAVNVSSSNVNASHTPSLVDLGGKPILIYKERLMLASIHSLKAVELDLQGRPQEEALTFQEIVAVPYNPAAASNGRTIMIASNSFSSGKWSLTFTPLRSLKKQPEQVEPIESDANLWAPAIVSLGDGFLVAYRNNGDIVPGVEVAQVDTDGSLISIKSAAIMAQDFDFEPALISDGDQAILVLREAFLGEIYLNAERFGSGGNITGSEMLVKGVGLGEPASAVLMGGDICVAYESLAEGLGSVYLGCFEVPGGGS